MYQNNNQSVIKQLSKAQFYSHKVRNILSIFAIALTTILIAAVLTAGFSFFTTMKEAGDTAPGPGADGALMGTKAQFEQVKELPQVEWVNFVQRCSTTSLHNDVFSGIKTELFAPDNNFYKNNMVELKSGKFPENYTEIIISDTLAKTLTIEEVTGQKLYLQVVITKNGNQEEKEFPFTICGFYQNPLRNISSIYEEIYTDSSFITQYNPELGKNQNYIYIKLNNLNPFLMKSDVYDNLIEIKDIVNADAVSTNHTDYFMSSFIMIFPMLLFVIAIMTSGYFLIYNVFYISIVSDIQWFGMLKTIGTTEKQLKAVLRKQIRLLAFCGIIIGSIIGYIIGVYIAPGIVRMTEYSIFYKAPNFFIIFLFSILFSWITVCISSRKPLKTASSIAPIEAMKYSPPKKKKNLFTILSFAMSGVVFLVVCNVTIGFQIEHMVERYNQEDFRIFHELAIWSAFEPYKPISKDLGRKLEELPFIEQIDVIYEARTLPDYSDTNFGSLYESSKGTVKLSGKLKEEKEELAKINPVTGYDKGEYLTENETIKLKITGLPVNRLEKETKYVDILEGTIDKEKFASGDYILYSSVDYEISSSDSVDKNKLIHAGDRIELSFYDDITESYYKKTVTVMAVVKNGDMFGTGDILYSDIVMPDTVFKNIYSNYEERIAYIQIIAKEELTKEQVQIITNLIGEEHNTQIKINSRDNTRTYYIKQKQSLGMMGIFMAGLLGIIGISNIINTVASDMFSRKKELTIRRSIGMTQKQICRMFFLDSFKICLKSFVIMIPLGVCLTYLVASNVMFTGFSFIVFVESIIVIFAISIIICIILSSLITRELNKKTVVERLRELV